MKTLLYRPLCMVLFLLGMQGTALAQTDTTRLAKPTLAFTGFVDVFYAYDSHRPQGDARQPFLYNHNRHNRFELNLGLVRLKLNHAKVRATVALHAGTYVNDNYAAEPEVLRHVAEANVGVALAGKGRLWLDVGIMPSHIGFESAISVDNQTLTRSLLAENSPYYLAAAKFTYTLHKKWEVAALVCNGWQRIRPVVGNTLPGFGTQVVWKPKDGLSLNWSTFIGTDDPDTTRRVRFFNNLYAQWQAHKNVGVTVGLDIGMQQQTKGSVAAGCVVQSGGHCALGHAPQVGCGHAGRVLSRWGRGHHCRPDLGRIPNGWPIGQCGPCARALHAPSGGRAMAGQSRCEFHWRERCGAQRVFGGGFAGDQVGAVA
jgi:hypothetical protein